MALLEVTDLHFTYPEQTRSVLSGIDFSVRAGELIVLCGPSGCGKTTLLRLLKSELQPAGRLQGEVRFYGKPLPQQDPAELACRIGLVQQDPENQIVMENVRQELAFGLENMGVPADVMRRRIAELAHFFGLERWLHKRTETLSGGQKQIVNLAAALLLQPDLLLLDEPTAQLDPVTAKDFLQMLRRLNEELGITVIVTEHRLEELLPMADRVLMLGGDGRLEFDGASRDWVVHVHQKRDPRYEPYLPSLARLYLSVHERKGKHEAGPGDAGEVPLQVKEGKRWIRQLLAKVEPDQAAATRPEQAADKPRAARPCLLECREVTFGYADERLPVLRQLDLKVEEGAFLAIVGGNGAGKSTLLKLAAGLEKPKQGDVLLRGMPIRKMKRAELYRELGYLSQNPLAYFLEDTVEEELRRAAERSGGEGSRETLRELIELLNLQAVLRMHPHDLSGGELQRAALAGVLLSGPKLLLLDEPTKGLDPQLKKTWGELLTGLHKKGVTIVMVTHDVEFAAAYASECAMLFDGEIASTGAPGPFFSQNFFYTTAINRVARELFPDAVTFREVMNRCARLVSPS
ncbi:ABC transporter ATP-binding protein [Paenibacillus chartarius]|uniref:ABC transporter ATP-binding protein n=1 Tax=Paenibacillus chartarius TaxID=747481 RepID=A0ABV6DFZ4_9BACL